MHYAYKYPQNKKINKSPSECSRHGHRLYPPDKSDNTHTHRKNAHCIQCPVYQAQF